MKIGSAYLSTLRLAGELLVKAEISHQALPVLQLALLEVVVPIPHGLVSLIVSWDQRLLGRLGLFALVLRHCQHRQS